MRIIKIHKGGGRWRTVYVPSKAEKARLSAIVPWLAGRERGAAATAGVASVAHGFVIGRSPITCAVAHVGFSVTVSVDLASWFDTVTQSHLIEAGVDLIMAERITVDGACRQGLPTSPSAANLVAVRMDREIVLRLDAMGVRYAYTRYADDLVVSGPDTLNVAFVVAHLTECAEAMGWCVAEQKTRVQWAAAGKRIVAGIAVDAAIGPTRKTRRRLRAARQSNDLRKIRGLEEWAACKLPNAVRHVRRLHGIASGGYSGPSEASKMPESQTKIVTADGRRLVIE